jgi:hypothetical protein
MVSTKFKIGKKVFALVKSDFSDTEKTVKEFKIEAIQILISKTKVAYWYYLKGYDNPVDETRLSKKKEDLEKYLTSSDSFLV